MRHRKQRFSLNRFSSLRKATIKELARSILLHQRIVTTEKKAKAVRPTVEKIIRLAKIGGIPAMRKVYDLLGDHSLVKTIFSDIAPLFSKRQSGFTRIILWKQRRGDNAQLVILELTEQRKSETKKKAKQVQKPVEQVKEQAPQPEEKSTEEKKKGFLGGLRTFLKKEKES